MDNTDLQTRLELFIVRMTKRRDKRRANPPKRYDKEYKIKGAIEEGTHCIEELTRLLETSYPKHQGWLND